MSESNYGMVPQLYHSSITIIKLGFLDVYIDKRDKIYTLMHTLMQCTLYRNMYFFLFEIVPYFIKGKDFLLKNYTICTFILQFNLNLFIIKKNLNRIRE